LTEALVTLREINEAIRACIMRCGTGHANQTQLYQSKETVMANQMTTRENGVPASRQTDVFEAMRSELDRVFDRFHHGWPSLPTMFGSSASEIVIPTLDLKDTGKSIVIEAELPGVDEKDVSVTFKDGVLTLKGEKRHSKEEKGENHYLMERSYGSFQRSVQLPDGIDENKVDARYDKGVLTITAEKKPDAVKAAKHIEIRKG
jgi:HSP20 family protein